MPIIAMPDGTHLDLGDNPSDEIKTAVGKKYQELEAAAGGKKTAITDTPTSEGSQSATTTTPVSGEEPKTPLPLGGWGPTVARIGPPLAAGAIAAVTFPPAILPAIAAASIAGGTEAQREEIAAGERKQYNPLAIGAETASNVAFAGLPMGDAITTAVARAGFLNVVSSNAISMAEGQGVNSNGQNAIAFLTGGGLHAVGHYAQIRSQAVKEFAGVPQIEEHVDLMTRPDAPTHGPDGTPTEVPAPTVLDEFGRPIERQSVYPEIAGPPKPEVGPADPAAQIADPGVTTGEGPTKVGQTPVKRTTGLSLSSKRSQTKQAVLDTYMEQRRPGIFEAEPIDAEKPPVLNSVTPKQPLLEPDGGMEDLGRQADEPVHDMPGNGGFNDPSDMTQKGIMRYVGRTKGYFIKLDRETGFPVYNDYDRLSQAFRKSEQLGKELSNPANKALRGTDRSDWEAMIQDSIGGADGGSLKPKLRAKMETVTNVADKALEPYGITSHDLFSEYLPALADNNQDALQQDKWAKFQDAMIAGKVNLETSDLPRMMQQITKMGAQETHLNGVIRDLKDKYSAKLDAPESVKQAINYYTGVLDGTPDRLAQGLGASITHIAAKFGWKVDGPGIANRMVSTQYAAMLAGRPGPVIRRLLHPIQTAAGPMGFSWLAEGYRQMATAAGRSAVESSGLASESIMRELAASGKTKIGHFVDQTVSKLMAPFGYADLLSRGPVYLGTRAKILWAAEKYGDNLDTFLRKSGVGRYSQQEANIITDLVNRGDAAGAADRGAQMMVDNTQFMYSALERPRAFTGVGRSVGAFGVWPAQYGEYLGRMANRGANGTWFDVGRDYARFLTANAAMVGAFYGAGKFINDKTDLTDTLGWSMVSHPFYTGSPLLGSMIEGGKQLKSTVEGRPPKASEVFRNVAAPFIPLSGLGMDVVRSSKEANLTDALGRYSGLRRHPLAKSGGGGGPFSGRSGGPFSGKSKGPFG